LAIRCHVSANRLLAAGEANSVVIGEIAAGEGEVQYA
jgi:hypothetical protein